MVVLVTGAGCAIATSIGALAGGYAANHVNRGYLYLGAAAAIAAVSLTLALTGHTLAAFVAGALIYNALTGVVYASFNALGFQLVGRESAVASTQLALFTAAINAAVVYMTWADGQGYKYFGVRGLFLMDAVASAVALIPLLLLVRRGLRVERQMSAVAEAEKRVTLRNPSITFCEKLKQEDAEIILDFRSFPILRADEFAADGSFAIDDVGFGRASGSEG